MASRHPAARPPREGYPLRGLIGLPVGLFVVVVIGAWLLCPALRANLGRLEAVVALPLVFVGVYALSYALAGSASSSTVWDLVWLALGCAVVVLSIYEHRVFTRSGAGRGDDGASGNAAAP